MERIMLDDGCIDEISAEYLKNRFNKDKSDWIISQVNTIWENGYHSGFAYSICDIIDFVIEWDAITAKLL